MNDICERLRSEVVWEPEVGQLLSDAANEIERLRLENESLRAKIFAGSDISRERVA